MRTRSIESDFYLFIKYAQNESSWADALKKVESGEDTSLLSDALGYITTASGDLPGLLGKMNTLGISAGDVAKVLSMGKNIPGLSLANEQVDVEKLKKFAKKYDKLSPQEQQAFLKQAGFLDSMLSGGSKLLSAATLVWDIFSAIKNIYYAVSSFQELTAEAETLGLSWLDCLYASRLQAKIKEYEDNPTALGILGYVAQVSKNFIQYGIGALQKSIDTGKDVFFMFFDDKETQESGGILSMISKLGNFKSSILTGLGGILLTKWATRGHENVVSQIKGIINSKISNQSLVSSSTKPVITESATVTPSSSADMPKAASHIRR